MPYKVFKTDGEYCVHKHDADGNKTGDALGCHKTRKAAMDQMRALYASEKDSEGGKSFALYDQDDVAYTPLSPKQDEACAVCRWFRTYGSEYSTQDSCHIVNDWPDAIEPTGWCSRFEARTRQVYEPAPMPVYVVDAPEDADKSHAAQGGADSHVAALTDEERALLSSAHVVGDGKQVTVTDKTGRGFIQAVIAKAGVFLKRPTDDTPQTGGFKVYKDASGVNRWVGWWSNNFRDREGEFFTEKAIDDYIARVDAGIVPHPELWHWHVPGSKHGKADWLGRIGHLCVAAGTFDDTPQGRAAAAHYASGKARYSMSHGFTYDARYKLHGVYHQFNTFEVTTLPPPVAANAFTDFEGVKEMTLTPEKREALEKLFGKDKAAEIIAETEAKSKALEQLGVEFKDFAHAEGAAEKEAVERVEADLKTLIPDLMQGSAEAVTAALEAVKQVKSLKAEVATLREENKALKAQLDDRPRMASRAAETEVDPAKVEDIMADNAKEQFTKRDAFWGTEVSELPTGN